MGEGGALDKKYMNYYRRKMIEKYKFDALAISLGLVVIFTLFREWVIASQNVKFLSPLSVNPDPIVIEKTVVKSECPALTTKPEVKKRARASYYIARYDGVNCDDPNCIMANGQPFDENANTMACANSLPLGAKIKLSYQGKSEVATCTDRGAFDKWGRTFDLSRGLFSRLAPISNGVILLEWERV